VGCDVRTVIQLWCRNDETPKSAKNFPVAKENLGYIYIYIPKEANHKDV
jgi:hypothetical protein